VNELTLLHVDAEQIGYGRAGVYLAEGLRRRGITVYTDLGANQADMPQFVAGERVVPETPTNLACVVSVPSQATGWYDGQHRAILTMWEAARLPEAFRQTLGDLDTIIVPSDQNLELFSRFHDNVHLCYLGVDVDRWAYQPVTEPGLTFDFLISGRGARKGTDIAHEAFSRVFGGWWEYDENSGATFKYEDRPMPRLVMKSINGHSGFGAPWVQQVRGWIPPEEEVALYARSHCYLGPSRGEGFGLQPLQAIVLGRPTILTNAHGHASYAELGIPISAKEVDAGPFIFGDAGNWWEPDLEEVCEAMWDVYHNYANHARAAAAAAPLAAKDFSWDRCVDRFIDILGDEIHRPYTGNGEWTTPKRDLFPIVTLSDRTINAAGVTRFFKKGQVYWDYAEIQRSLFDAGVLNPVCLSDEHNGLALEQLPGVDQYRAMHEHCPTCGQLLNEQKTLADKIMDGEVQL
jgi:glycosyltransferase involved in cell wall biosynthesis